MTFDNHVIFEMYTFQLYSTNSITSPPIVLELENKKQYILKVTLKMSLSLN